MTKWSRAAVLALAAAAPAAAQPPKPVPIVLSLPPDPVSYTLERLPGPTGAFRITLTCRAGSGPTSTLGLQPEWGGVEHCGRFIHNLEVRSSTGKALACTPYPGGDPAGPPHQWVVTHEPDADLTVTYELRPAETDPFATHETRYEPVVRPDLLHLIAETGLLSPAWLDAEQPRPIRIAWRGLDANNLRAAASALCTSPEGEATISLDALRHSLFLAGDFRLLERPVRGGTLRMAILGSEWGFRDGDLAGETAKVIDAERAFFGDFEDPCFLVTVSPVGKAAPGSFSLGGTGLTNCFALFLTPGTSLDPGSDQRRRVLHVLAHEYFHTWTGGKIPLGRDEQSEGADYWFSEGFTDFYASRILLRAGLIDRDAWLARLNERLARLWLSPVAAEPASRIVRDFWADASVQELPYLRGEAVALMIDAQIRADSAGVRSLDDFMRETLAAARAGEKASTDVLLARIARWTSGSFAAAVRRTVVDGPLPELPSLLPFPDDAAPAGLTREIVERHRWDPGFDVDGSLQATSVRGVVPGSAAERAGLRDGQSLKGWSIARGNPDRPIELRVLSDAGEVTTLTFFPHGEAVHAPQYTASPASPVPAAPR